MTINPNNYNHNKLQSCYSSLLNSILRTDFKSFIHKTFNTLNPGIKFEPNWHIDLIADRLNKVARGEITRLIINMPPRSLKSLCVSVAWPAWLLGHNPTQRILVASYANSLSVKHSLDTRTVMNEIWYQQLYPNTILSKTHNLKTKFLTTKNGFRLSTSVNGSITGEGGDILILDDPHNPIHINSTKRRNKTIEWFEQTFATRLDNRSQGKIVIVMQRLHVEDLCGYLTKKMSERWEILKIPVLAQTEQHYYIKDKCIIMNIGDVLHKNRDKPEYLENLKQELGNYNFTTQYLQSPLAPNSYFVSPHMIKQYDHTQNINFIIQSWDTAATINSNSDYTVCTTWGISRENIYLLNLIRERVTYPQLKSLVQRAIFQDNPKYILIENKSSGQALIQDLQYCGIHNIVPQKPSLDKITRFTMALPFFESGKVFVPRCALWLTIFYDEIINFPHTKHDDIVDSTSQLINFISRSKIECNPRIRVI